MSLEQIDVLDEQGNNTGRVLSFDEVHQNELWHGVAHIWVYNDKGQMLMQQRGSDVAWAANKWDLAGGGHISAGETPKQAAMRELSEELGLEVNEKDLIQAGKTYAENTTPKTGKLHRAWEWNYIAKMDVDLSEVKLQAEETQKVAWMDLDQIEKDLDDEEAFSKYAPRNTSLYRLVIRTVRENLKS
jgi:isopentenyldiphosphate isomerase